MKEFFKNFWKTFSKIGRLEKIYYFSYATVISVAYVGYTMLPILYGKIVDKVILKQPYWDEIIWYGMLTVIFLLIFRLWSLGNITVQRKVKMQLSNRLFAILLKNQQKDSNLFNVNLEGVSKLFLDFVYTIPSEIFAFLAGFVVISYYSAEIAALLLVGVTVFLLLTKLRENWVLPVQNKNQEIYRSMYETLDELIRATEEIQLLEKGDWADKRLEHKYAELETVAYSYSKRAGMVGLVNSLNTWLLPCLATLVAFFKLVDGSFSIGACLVVIQFANLLNNEFISIHQNINYLMDFVPHLRQVEHYFLMESERAVIVKTKELPKNTLLSVEGLSMKFGDRQLFSQLSFTVDRGEILAIKGESGCGKSTLLSIIAGRLTQTDGQVFLNQGTTLGVLHQDFYLFQRTLKENLLVAKPNASAHDLEKALQKAGLEEYCKSLPKGLDTKLGEGGSAMSGGQRTRLGLAQVLLQDADLILLDEPLTNVDSLTRSSILEELKDFLKEKACILVTHESEISEINTKTLLLKDFSLTVAKNEQGRC